MRLFNFFTSRRGVARQPDYVQVQSYNGNTYHILHNTDQAGFSRMKNALCGYPDWLRMATMKQATVKEFSSDTSDYFWNYCGSCRDTLAQLDAGITDLSLLPVKAAILD